MEDPTKLDPTEGPPVQPPDPAAEPPLPPRPVKSQWLMPFGVLGILTAAAGGLFVLVQALPGRTMGATRSYRLRCEDRQQQIEVVAQQEAAQPLSATTQEAE